MLFILLHCIEPVGSDIGIIGAPFDTAVSYRPGKPAQPLAHSFLVCCSLQSYRQTKTVTTVRNGGGVAIHPE